MRTKFRKSISMLLTLVLTFALIVGIPLLAIAEVEKTPFMVTEHGHPIGADYMLGDTAVALSAEFYYRLRQTGYVADEPITVEWYWSYVPSNTSRSNLLGETTLEGYNFGEMTFQVTHVPATDTVGVRYYYAVLYYTGRLDSSVPEKVWETVTNPARVAVTEPPKNEQDFTVYKTDENGAPLAGATIRVEGENDEGVPHVYDVVTNSDGEASFTVEYGQYELSEHTAPAGYNGTDESYRVSATPNGLYIFDEQYPDQLIEEVVFVNKEIPKPDPEPEQLTHRLTVRKTDGDGEPLAGATIHIEGMREDGTPFVFDVVTNSGGVAIFTIDNGEYELSESAAPDGYNATDDTYIVKATPDGLFIFDEQHPNQPIDEVVFVNKEIPPLNKDDHFAYMQGYPDGTFKPGNNMTRAEAVVMFSRLLEKTMDVDTDYRGAYYPDVLHTSPWAGADTQPWYANQVCFMHWKGVLASFSRDGRFRPNDPVTRAEFATLASHFEKLELTDTNIFSDVPDNHWAVKFINSAAAKGWIIGYSDGTFAPDANITRAEVVTLVNRILERKADEGYLAANAVTLPRSYSDVGSHWARLAIMEASMGHDYDISSAGDETWTKVYP